MADPVNRSHNPYSAPRDGNRVPTLLGVSTADGITPVPLEVDPNTGLLQVSGGGGGGGGTQYTDGGVPPAHPIGNAIEWSDGSNWQTVSTLKPLPVSATFTPSGTQDVNIKQISGTTASVNNGTTDAGTQRVTLSSDSTGQVKLATGANTIGAISNTSFTANIGTTNGLALDATLTGGTQQTKLTDGTNVANVLKSDGTAAGQNAQIVSPTFLSVPFTTTTVQAVGTTDAGNYRWVSIQITSQGTSSTINFQISNDNTNWAAMSMTGSNNTNPSTYATSTTTTTTFWSGPLLGRYFRLNVTGISAGTTAGTIVFSSMAVTPNQAIAGVSSTSSIGSTYPTTAFAAGLTDGSNLRPWIVASGATDGTSGTSIAGVGPYVWNGASFDRFHSGGVTGMIGISGDTASAATDAGNPVKVGTKYNLTQPTFTDGQRAELQVTSRGELRTTITTSGTSAAVNGSAGAAGMSNTVGTLAVRSYGAVFNGTTWDPLIGATGANNTTGTGLLGAAELAVAATALPSAATATNYTTVMADKFGRQVVLPGIMRDLVGTQATTISASTSETTIVTAAASTFNDLTALVISNTSATATRMDFRDTTAGSVLFSLYIPAGDMRGIAFQRPVPQTTVNTNWTAQSSASVTDLRVYAVFDKNK